MAPVIRVDQQVMDYLKKQAITLGLVFEPPNATLRTVLGLDKNTKIDNKKTGHRAIRVINKKTGEILESSSGAEACRYLGLEYKGDSANRILVRNGYEVQKL